ncbi:MAG: PA2169 family four-helix-bundle protein [Bacteroidota bacterium]
MATTENKVSILNDLIIINNDRCEGYRKAAEETKDSSLKDLFNKYSRQSDEFNRELRTLVNHEDEPDRGETTLSGKLYRVWMDVKSSLAGNDRKSVLNSCEYGEDVALGTYKEALEDELSGEARNIVQRQKSEIQEAHNYIRSLRDQEK